ncbi:hypothetical protein V6R21_19095 [Limibacter armeniacum]|uniref:hypothetical protein n=1 Tax=Limibacter armeniacum TaxID=466084 RepID=UPI002FE50D90
MFDIDFSLITYRLLPSFLRKGTLLSWIYLLVHNIKILTADFKLFRSQVKDELIWGRSKLAVETLARERFNNQNIFLVTQLVELDEFLVFPPEYRSLTPLVAEKGVAKVKVRPPGEAIDLFRTQLTVQVPVALQPQENEIKVFLSRYLHVAVIYEIEYI